MKSQNRKDVPKMGIPYQLGLNLSGDGGQSNLEEGGPLNPENEPLEQRCRACQSCPLLVKERTQVVLGSGNTQSRLLLFGEAPGADEDRSGKPFVGKSGKLFRNLLSQAGFASEDDYFITNIVKCHPPGNRNPYTEEIDACRHWLDEEIQEVSPLVIVAVGATAFNAILGPGKSITRHRGHWFLYRNYPVMPTFHPAYLIRQGRAKGKRLSADVIADLCKVRERILGYSA